MYGESLVWVAVFWCFWLKLEHPSLSFGVRCPSTVLGRYI